MKTSIATVSLSGTLGEKLEAIAAAKFDAVEIFENDLITFRRSGWTSSPCSRSATSRACRPDDANGPWIAPNASSTSCRNSAPIS